MNHNTTDAKIKILIKKHRETYENGRKIYDYLKSVPYNMLNNSKDQKHRPKTTNIYVNESKKHKSVSLLQNNDIYKEWKSALDAFDRRLNIIPITIETLMKCFVDSQCRRLFESNMLGLVRKIRPSFLINPQKINPKYKKYDKCYKEVYVISGEHPAAIQGTINGDKEYCNCYVICKGYDNKWNLFYETDGNITCFSEVPEIWNIDQDKISKYVGSFNRTIK